MKKETKNRLMKSILAGTLTTAFGVGAGFTGARIQKLEDDKIMQKYEQTLDSQSDKIDTLIAENNSLKSENESLINSGNENTQTIEELLAYSATLADIVRDLNKTNRCRHWID